MLILGGVGSDNATLVLAAQVIAQCGTAATSVSIFSLPAVFVVGAAAATAFALITTLGNLAGYASLYLIAVLRDATGNFSAAFFGLASLTLLGALIILITSTLRCGVPAGGGEPAPR